MEGVAWKAKFPSFPYQQPYQIQIDFMNALYDALDRGGVAMLESPTGTGKTLSIICSALQWILDQKQKPKRGTFLHSVSDDEPDWMRDFDSKKPQSNARPETHHKLRKSSSSFGMRACDHITCSGSPVDSVREKQRGPELDEDGDFLLEDYASEDDVENSKRKASGSLCSSDELESEEDKKEEEEELKVFFCSRTHSQLSQFVKELRKTDFASKVNVLCLGSRKNFCINKDVVRLGSSSRIAERCLELQKSKNQQASKIKIQREGRRIRRTITSSGCPMLQQKRLQKQFRSEASNLGVLDIEDLVQLGRKIGTCPYYGSRSMLPSATLVVLPYQSLLLKSSRQSLGLNLRNSVIIIDEAHNIADSLINMYNAKITLSQLEQVHWHLRMYLDRFKNLLGAGNQRYIQTLMVLTEAFLKLLAGDRGTKSDREGQLSDSSLAINDFLFSLDIDNINLVKLQSYIKQSKIARKVSGYGAKIVSMERGLVPNDGESVGAEGTIVSAFQAFADILNSLTNADVDGRIIVARRKPSGQQAEGYIKYVMLAGEKLFNELVEQVHAVVLAGGTLQPIEETRDRLFPNVSADKFHFFSCNHIVPPESVLPIAVSRGPTGVYFDFSYNSRSSRSMMEELGRLVCNLAGIVPEGIVIFFPSFEYKAQICDVWNTSGIFARIMKKKLVFKEPRSSSEVENVLKEYKEAVFSLCNDSRRDLQHNGAVLLAVVGGKMSEGINFSDGMGRCVIMVGLPYPTLSDVELLERIRHIGGFNEHNVLGPGSSLGKDSCTQLFLPCGFDILKSCKRKGREYYENLCMKAVNQSIGRAIRHIGDYAAILLVDSRYAHNPSKRVFSQPTTKLPLWIKSRLVSSPENYGEVHRLLCQFYKLNGQRRCQQQIQSG